MRPSVRSEAMNILSAYELHRNIPVRLDPLEDLFLIRHTDMEAYGLAGAILTPPLGWPVSPQNRARILVDYSLTEWEARLTIAHEIGHGICHHPGNLSSLSLGLEDKHERQAWEVAALLLIPQRVVYEEQEVSRVAAACMVPEWLVELWPL